MNVITTALAGRPVKNRTVALCPSPAETPACPKPKAPSSKPSQRPDFKFPELFFDFPSKACPLSDAQATEMEAFNKLTK
jgi:hypothetical protein